MEVKEIMMMNLISLFLNKIQWINIKSNHSFVFKFALLVCIWHAILWSRLRNKTIIAYKCNWEKFFCLERFFEDEVLLPPYVKYRIKLTFYIHSLNLSLLHFQWYFKLRKQARFNNPNYNPFLQFKYSLISEDKKIKHFK